MRKQRLSRVKWLPQVPTVSQLAEPRSEPKSADFYAKTLSVTLIDLFFSFICGETWVIGRAYSELQTVEPLVGFAASQVPRPWKKCLWLIPPLSLLYQHKSHATALALGLKRIGFGALNGLWPQERGSTLGRGNKNTAKISRLVDKVIAEAVK